MTLKRYTFETGPDGGDLTTGNTGADQYNVAPGGTATFDHDTAQVGQFGARFVSTGGAVVGRFNMTAANAKLAFEMNFIINDSLPSSGRSLVSFLDPSNVNGPAVQVDENGRLALFAKGGAGGAHVIESPISADTGYRLAIVFDITSGTTATYTANLYTGQSTTPVNASPVTGSLDAGISSFNGAYIGCVGSSVATDVTCDAVSFNDGATSEIGPAPNPTTPADTVNPSSVVSNPGSWTAFGTSDLVAAVSDDSNSTGIQSPAAGGSITYALAPLTGGPVTLKLPHRLASGSSGGTRVYELLCDGTPVKTSDSVTLPSSATTYVFGPTTTAETALITDRTKLQLKITDTPA